MAQQQIINIGATANDGTGDPLRVAFEKVNNNFTNLWATGYTTLEASTTGNTPGQLIVTIPVTQFTQAVFQINSSDQTTNDSQNIVINAALNNDKTSVNWNGHSTLFFGNAVTRYSMNVSSGNVNLYVDPIVNKPLTHWVSYQVTVEPVLPGITLVLNQDNTNAISSENVQSLTIEN